MTSRERLGGVIHTYLAYDPQNYPPPNAEPPDMVSSAFDHAMTYGSLRHLTEEELARAVKLDPSQIANLGPSLDALIAMLEERKRKILAQYETEKVRRTAKHDFQKFAEQMTPPKELRKQFQRAVAEGQIYEL